jgi:hypothetical protein
MSWAMLGPAPKCGNSWIPAPSVHTNARVVGEPVQPVTCPVLLIAVGTASPITSTR